jgi:hypothetical protein
MLNRPAAPALSPPPTTGPGGAPGLRAHPVLPTRGRRRYSLGAVRRGERGAREAYHSGSSTFRPHR